MNILLPDNISSNGFSIDYSLMLTWISESFISLGIENGDFLILSFFLHLLTSIPYSSSLPTPHIQHDELKTFCLFNELLLVIVIIFEVQIVPNLPSESPFKLTSVSLDIILFIFVFIFSGTRYLRPTLLFLSPDMEPAMSPRGPGCL